MNNMRRLFLRGLLASFTALVAALIVPTRVWAVWTEKAFMAKTKAQALTHLLGNKQILESDKIYFTLPEIAEDGAVVPISIQTDLDLVESITIISDKNPNPINASFIIPAGTKPEISTRIRLAETTQVMVVVKSAGKLYSASKEVTVTIGGCDG